MATPKQVRRRGRLSFLLGTIVAAGLFAAVAWADIVQNDVETSGDIVTVTAGGAGASVGYRIQANNGDGLTGCNASDGSMATVTPTGLPAGVAKSPSSISFAACTNTFQSIVFTAGASVTPGDYAINVSVSDSGAGTYNTSPARFTLRVQAPADSTPPVITPNVSGTLGDNGWYTSNVVVTWSVVDNESPVSSSNGCGSTTISSDTTGTTLTCSATSAGGTGSNSVTITRDATAPSIVRNAAADSCDTPGDNGWCRGEQTAGFTASDATSGLASDGAASRNFTKSTSSNGSSVSIASGTVTDVAGNANAGINATGFKIDSVAPTLTCESPAPAFLLNQPNAQVSLAVSDATSLPVNATEYGNADTSSVGSKTVGITGKDNAGNSASASCSYSVGYRFDGLYAPVDRPNTLNVSKAGQAIPLKWRLTDFANDPVTNLTQVTVSVSGIACALGGSADQVEEIASGSSGLQNLGDGYYQFNWKTPTSYANSCKQLNLKLGAEAQRTNLALFSFKR
jgi:hypothetical protein